MILGNYPLEILPRVGKHSLPTVVTLFVEKKDYLLLHKTWGAKANQYFLCIYGFW